MSVDPMFWSDIGLDIGLEGVGKIDSSLETVGIYTQSKEEIGRAHV